MSEFVDDVLEFLLTATEFSCKDDSFCSSDVALGFSCSALEDVNS